MLIIGIFLSACLFGIVLGTIYLAVMFRSEAMQRMPSVPCEYVIEDRLPVVGYYCPHRKKDVDNPRK